MSESSPESLRVAALAGSLRERSFNRALLAAAADRSPEALDLSIVTLDDIPLFNADVEAEGVPESVTELRASVESADGLLIATPEYNQGVPGILKNAIDWLSRPPKPHPLDGRPVAILGATPGGLGTRSAQYQLRQTLTGLNALTMAQPMLFVSAVHQKFDENLELSDDDLGTRLTGFLAAFETWIRRLAP